MFRGSLSAFDNTDLHSYVNREDRKCFGFSVFVSEIEDAIQWIGELKSHLTIENELTESQKKLLSPDAFWPPLNYHNLPKLGDMDMWPISIGFSQFAKEYTYKKLYRSPALDRKILTYLIYSEFCVNPTPVQFGERRPFAFLGLKLLFGAVKWTVIVGVIGALLSDSHDTPALIFSIAVIAFQSVKAFSGKYEDVWPLNKGKTVHDKLKRAFLLLEQRLPSSDVAAYEACREVLLDPRNVFGQRTPALTIVELFDGLAKN